VRRLILPVLVALTPLAACGAATPSRGEAVATRGAQAGRVVDRANVLTPEQEAALAVKSAALEAKTGHQLVVVTVASLDGKPIEAYSLALANEWGIGRAGVNDGVLLLVAPNERKVRIEVGLGLPNKLPDAEAARIIEEVILPEFREGRLPEGIAKGADAIAARLSEGGR
jgi:uncharacterized protein